MAVNGAVVTSGQILDALRKVSDPNTGKDVVSLGWVANIHIQTGRVTFDLHIAGTSDQHAEVLREQSVKAIRALPGVQAVMPNIRKKPKPRIVHGQQAIPGVNNVIVVGSGKGGVGKSTSSVNIAMGLRKLGYKVGLLDADIYGPSVPTMLAKEFPKGKTGVAPEPEMRDGQLVPFDMFGLKVISLGLLVAKDQPTVWRAPMATKMIQQFLTGVFWGELDFLIIDLPPGTGDIQLTLSQQSNLAGAIVVTSPQNVAMDIAKKGLLMFKHVGVPILGVVETMSGFGCDSCGSVTQIFGSGAGKKLAEEFSLPLLGKIPLDAALVRACDDGEPIVYRDTKSASAQAYMQVAAKIVAHLETMDTLRDDSEREIVPLAVEGMHGAQAGDGHKVAVYWSDGQKYVYSAKQLRYLCPCAVCVDEFTGERRIQESNVDQEVFLEKALPVGRYGVNLQWSDQHNTGIYTYRYLREVDAERSRESLPDAPQPQPVR